MLPYKTRKRLSYLILSVGVPLYIVVAVTLVNWIERTWGRPPIWAEFLVYVGLGFLWMLPLKPIFKGVGQADPDDQSGKK
jgi:predicted membrane channel-forming protein YqfA (hemolysin III family)